MGTHLVVIGASLGGLKALHVILPVIPNYFHAALVIVLHCEKVDRGDLISLLSTYCVLPVTFPLDKEVIMPGHVYVAPPNYHLFVEGDHFAYSVDAPADYFRPAINVLFESAASACRKDVTGIILTGTRTDGARGLAAISLHGGQVFVQSPEEAYAPELPRAALALVPNAPQLTLKEIGMKLANSYSCGIAERKARHHD